MLECLVYIRTYVHTQGIRTYVCMYVRMARVQVQKDLRGAVQHMWHEGIAGCDVVLLSQMHCTDLGEPERAHPSE